MRLLRPANSWPRTFTSRFVSSLSVALEVRPDGTVSTEGVSNASDAWLASMPKGAYANARTFCRHSIFEFNHHVDTLAKSHDSLGSTPITSADVEKLVRPLARTGMLAYRRTFPDYNGELKLCFLILPSTGKVAVHITPLGKMPLRPVVASFGGTPRSNAAAKDSAWISSRLELSAAASTDVNEILLVEPTTGKVLEGASSNFFAVVDEREVHTADDGILKGSVRRVLLQVCRERGIPLIFAAPTVDQAPKWTGALITSTSRLALALDQIRDPQHSATFNLISSTGLAGQLSRWVDEKVGQFSVRILDPSED